ncbi:MAG TPA: AMP-binding protein, partial [Minicystis sp.]|nr:AMP-binding protein [Minicystis sp.]
MPEPRTIHALVSARAQQTPDARAIGAPGRPTLSYAALAAHVEAVGRRLRAVGVARGERVAIVLPNGPEMATAFLSIASFATAAPLNPAYREPEFEFFLTDLAPRALVIEQGLASPSRAVAARL